jgi:hypothetical protein
MTYFMRQPTTYPSLCIFYQPNFFPSLRVQIFHFMIVGCIFLGVAQLERVYGVRLPNEPGFLFGDGI